MAQESKEFIEYAETVKNALELITEDKTVAKDEKLMVLYAAPQIAFSKYRKKIFNGEKVGPLMTFYMSGCEIRTDCQLGGYKSLTLYRKDEDYLIRAPLICKLRYTITINCTREEQADVLQTQLMLGMPINRPYYTKLNGQYVTMTAEEPQNLSSVDVGDQKDKIIRRQLTVVIDRAYIEHPANAMSKQTAKTICLTINSEEAIDNYL